MATYFGGTTAGFESTDLWVANTGVSTNERFEDLVSQEGGLLNRIETYSTFAFESGGYTFEYEGTWTVTASAGLLTTTVAASGTYNTVMVRSGSDIVAQATGLSFPVDFGTAESVTLLDLLSPILTPVLALLFGGGTPESYGNLHTDATPNLAELTYAADDTLQGGSQDDALFGYDGNDTIDGGTGNDRLYGSAGVDRLYGESGNDTLDGSFGKDVLNGSIGRDILIGGRDRDLLTGGSNSDMFDFNSRAETGVTSGTRDQILDFQRGRDDIDLRTIDASTARSGNNAFKFIGNDAFSETAGELRIRDSGSHVVVQGDVNGDGRADFEILVRNVATLTKEDFIV